MEYWDLLDRQGRPLGKTHPRGKQYPMPRDTYHAVVQIFTVDAAGRLLLTRRSSVKRMYGGYWEVTGGSVLAGESRADGARRELREETGLDAPAAAAEAEGCVDGLIFLGTMVEPCGIVDCYLCRCAESAEQLSIVLQEGETDAFRWVSFYDFEIMIHRGEIPSPVAMRYGFVHDRLVERIGDGAFCPVYESDEATPEKSPEEVSS